MTGAVLLWLAAFGTSARAVAVERGQFERLSRVRVPFVEGDGGPASAVAFTASTLFGAVSVMRDGRLVYSMRRGSATDDRQIVESFASGRPRPTAGSPASARISRFVGSDRSRWRSDLPSYDEVSLGDVWPGVSVSLRAHAGNVEKLFRLLPGARVGRIGMRVGGTLAVLRDGSLAARTRRGEVRFSAPAAYQEVNGVRRPVSVAYIARGSTYGFRLEPYDHSLPLTIDPVLESSYVGGGDADFVNAITVHPSTGEVLVAGSTFSADLPGASGGARGGSGGGVDGFVARFDPTLSRLLQTTYLGGSGGDVIAGIAVHPWSGEVIVAGVTSSPDFPGTYFGAQFAGHGGNDGFVARLDPTLTKLLNATYFGGGDSDRVVGVAVHPTRGDVVIAGYTVSKDLPGTTGGAQPAIAADIDGFLARFDPTLAHLLQTTYLGGSGPDYIHTLAIHPASGEVLVGGQTLGNDLPATEGGANAGQPGNGNWDAFVARVDPTLTRFLQSTYLGGAGGDDVLGIAVSPLSGEIFVTGWTNYIDFPGTEGGAQPAAGGVWDLSRDQQHRTDGFVARFNPMLTVMFQATYLGGGGDDYCRGIAIDPSHGDVYVTGETFSTDLPGKAGGPAPVAAGGGDGFVARLNPTLTSLLQATYVGGGDADRSDAIAIRPSNGEVLVAGTTQSRDFPGFAAGAEPAFTGGSVFGGDGFVSRLSASLEESGNCVSGSDPLCANPDRLPVELTPRRGRTACDLPCH